VVPIRRVAGRRSRVAGGQLTYEETVNRIIRLAEERGGTITRADIEADEDLSRDHSLTSAAGHSLAGGTNVASVSADDGWFPYEQLSFGFPRAG